MLKLISDQHMSVLKSSFNMPIPKIRRTKPFPKAPSQFIVPSRDITQKDIKFHSGQVSQYHQKREKREEGLPNPDQ